LIYFYLGLLRINLGFSPTRFVTLKWNPIGNYILTGSEDGNIILWDTLGKAVRFYEMHNGKIKNLVISI
jgi:WD40 repeat protein